MSVRDALLLNLTGSNFQALQTNDTARVKGDLSLQKDDGTEVLGIDVSTATLNLTGGITGSGNISSSLSSTGSFGRVEATTFHGDATFIRDTLPRSPGIVTQSAQLAAQISGAFTAGFEFSSSISGSATSTGSFGRVEGELFYGDGSGIASTLPRSSGILTGSAQISSRISGSFNKGFRFTGTIQGAGGGPGAWSIGTSIGFEQANAGSVAVGQSPNAMLAHYGTGGDVFNGTSWSEITAAPSPTTYGIATGDYDAALLAGGTRSGSQSWNGSSWTVEGETNRANTFLASAAGTTEAALIFGGGSGSSDSIGHVSAQTELYDGSSWSEVNDMLIPKYKGSQTGIGSQNSTISHGGCGQAKTYDPPSPHSEFAISDPRQEGTHLEEWNGTNWSYLGDFYAHPQPSFFFHSGTGVGTTNAASFYGGYTHHYGGGGNNSTHYHWDGTAMANGTGMLIAKSNNDGAGQGGAGSAKSSIFGWYQPGYGGSHPTYGAAAIGLHEVYEPTIISTGSFGRLEFTKISGDGSGLTATLPYSPGVLSSSAQIASNISGAFTSGFEFSGEISGSATSTGSFGRIVANKFFGDATGIQASLPYIGVITSSAQLASNISGSFNKGFEFSGKVAAASSAWQLGPDMVNGRHRMGGKGTYNAAIAVAGGITNAPDHSEAGYVSHPSYFRRVCNTEEFNGTTWSEVNDLNFGGPRGYGGTTEDGAALGAEHPESNGTEHWNGTNWSEGPAVDTGTNHRDGSGGGCTPTKLYLLAGNYAHYKFTCYNKDTGTFSEATNTPSGLWYTGGPHTGESDALLLWGSGYHNAAAQTTALTQIWDGTSWTEVANSLFPDHTSPTGAGLEPGGGARIFPHPYAHVPSRGAGKASAGSGTVNDAYSYGGEGAYGTSMGQTAGNLGVSKHYNWDGSSWSYQGVIPMRGTGWTPGAKPPGVDVHGEVGPVVNYPAGMGHQFSTGVGAGAGDAFVFGGYYAMYPSSYPNHPSQYDFELSSGSYYYPEKQASLSAGLLNFSTGSGDATPLQGTFYPGVLSGSAQIASKISGSFNKGFSFAGEISGSATSTGSFGRLVADKFFGSATGIQSSLPYPSGILSSSAQIADRVSGSFTAGFTYGSEILGEKVTAGGAWATGGDLNVPRHSGAMAGTQNAAFYIAGALSSGHGWYGSGNQTCTEEYNGTNWSVGTAFPLDSEGTNLFPMAPAGPDPAYKAGTGTQNAALVFGGWSHYAVPQSTGSAFEYDGTAFTRVANMPEAMSSHIGAGTQNATISYGGQERAYTSPYGASTSEYAHTWDGSTWSNITKTNNDRTKLASTPNGTVNSTMAFGATANSPDFQSTECWNGSSWTECAEQNIRRVNSGGSGVPDDAQVFGGQGSYGSSTVAAGGTSEYWNGTVWVTGANLNRAQTAPGGDGANVRGAGTAAAALAAGGYPGSGAYTGTEEYVGASSAKLEYPVIHAKNFTGDATQFTASLFQGLISGSAQIASNISGAFSKGMGHVNNTGDNRQGSAGGVKHSFQAGAIGTGTWKTSTSAIVPRGISRLAGTQNSALLMGGDCVTSNGGCCVEAWDGTSWEHREGLAAHNDQGYHSGGGYGTQNAAMVTGGRPNAVSDTLQYNGTVWSEVNNFNYTRGRYAHSGCSQNDAIMTGGLGADNASQCSCTEIWDGTTWTEKDSPLRGVGHGHVGGGSSNAFIMGGSQVSPSQVLTEEWNGSSWSSHVDNLYSYKCRGQQGDGSIYNFMHFGGTNSQYPRLDSVEFFDGVGWKIGPHMLVPVGGSFNDGAGRGFGGGMGEGGGLTVGGQNPPNSYFSTAQMFDQEATSTGSFGTLKGFGESTLKTNSLFVSGSTFKLPLMSDKEINYQNYQPQEATGSLSGSFERKPDKDIFTRPGNFFFHSDYNALGYTYQSASIYSQSLDFTTCWYDSASVATASTGFITQSHYCYTTVVCYITGSYV